MVANKGIQLRANDQIVISVYRNICEEFINFRGLLIDDVVMDNKTLSEEIFKKGFIIIKCKLNSSKYDNKEQKNVYIVLYHFITSENLKAADVKKTIQTTYNIENKDKKWNSYDIILITQNTVSTHISNFIREHQSKERLQSNSGKCLFDHAEKQCNCNRNNLFAYTYSNFIITIPKHVLVPEYRILSSDEKDKTLRQLFINKSGNKLPKIKKSDPCVIWSRGIAGDVVEFIRDDEVTGKSVYYRMIV